MTPRARAAGAVVCAVLAGCALALARRDAALRARAEVFARAHALDRRREAYVETSRYAAAGDLAVSPLADAALEDAVAPTRLAGMTPEQRALWLDSARGLRDELRDAKALLVDAVALRPGWPYHQLMLGQLSFVEARRFGDPAATREAWRTPLTEAARRAPGDAATWSALAGALLDSWSRLPASERASGEEALRRAFADDRFFERVFPSAFASLGRESALRVVPEEPRALLLAQKLLGKTDVPAAYALHQRWRRLEREARASDLDRAEERSRRGDLLGLREAVRRWISLHSFRDFEDPTGSAELGRLVEIWPEERTGRWASDPRAEIVRFLLDGRAEMVSGPALARLGDGLSGVPDPVRAELFLLSGDRYGWQKLAGESGTIGTFEWTRFQVRVARQAIHEGALEEAEHALEQIAPRAREECAVLLVRRDLAHARGDADERARLDRAAAMLQPDEIPRAAWSATGSLSLCVDPERHTGSALRVRLTSPSPSLVSYGWDGARSGVVLVDREATLAVPLEHLSGRRTFQLASVAGPPAEPVETAITSR